MWRCTPDALPERAPIDERNTRVPTSGAMREIQPSDIRQ